MSHDVDIFDGAYDGATITLSNLASRIDDVDGVTATVSNSNYIYVESGDKNTPIKITGKSNGIQLFSATSRAEDLLLFKGIGILTLDTPSKVPNLTGYDSIKAAYNDTLTV